MGRRVFEVYQKQVPPYKMWVQLKKNLMALFRVEMMKEARKVLHVRMVVETI